MARRRKDSLIERKLGSAPTEDLKEELDIFTSVTICGFAES